MPTKPFYLFDSYLEEFEAKVQVAAGNQVVLDQTAFHPLTGGVACGIGYLAKGDLKCKVVKVERNKETKEITHMPEAAVADLGQGDFVRVC